MSLLSAAELADLWATWESALTDTCTITPAVAPGNTATPVTVACAVVLPTMDQGPYGGGGNALSRPVDVTVWVPRSTTVKTGDAIRWNDGATTYSAGAVGKVGTNDPGKPIACVEART